jgi:hypothetical protein
MQYQTKLGATVQNLVATAIWRPDLCTPGLGYV